jgi:hypothetical protein
MVQTRNTINNHIRNYTSEPRDLKIDLEYLVLV